MSLGRFFRSKRTLAAGVIALISGILAVGLDQLPGTSKALHLGDQVFYDWFYRHRPVESQMNGDVVIIAIDDKSLAEVETLIEHGWPWPRAAWYLISDYLQRAGAKVVTFDLLMSETSAKGAEDDEEFAARMDEVTIPVVFARTMAPDGGWGRFKPQIKRSVQFGSTAVSTEKVYREYLPYSGQLPSLALATLQAAGIEPRLPIDRPILLHFHGPHRDDAGKPTFPTWSAARVIAAAQGGDESQLGISPAMFKDKVVIVGAMAEALQDIKSTPNAKFMPGVEIHATAIANLMHGRQVMPVPAGLAGAVSLIFAALTAAGTVGFRSAIGKTAVVIVVVAAIIAGSFLLFLRSDIRWFPPVMALLAVLTAAILGIAWSYFIEDRQARMLLKALETCLSPSVAAELAANPRQLCVGGRQLDMTVMFTDLAGFTSLTEELKERIEPALNYYLGEMSEQILKRDGTLDKYIGDAIMTFWNAPVNQPDHALLACDAALAIQRREREIKQEMAALGMRNTITRIGVNSGSMFVGFTGSQRKLNYTVIGDAVNLAARLEPANKLYNTQICVAENTVKLVGDRYLFRKLDLLAVKGKSEPMAVYELLGDASARDSDAGHLAQGFGEAFSLYLQQEWDEADAILLELLRRFPDDGPSKTLRRRIAEFRLAPPPGDWDGVYHATSK